MTMSAPAIAELAERVEEVDGATYRSIMASFPSGVAIVTTGDADGRPSGFTATSVCSVSADPPIVLVSVDTTSRTLPTLRRTGRFVVNVMRAGRGELGARFASKEDDKFAGVAWCATPTGLPVLAADALAWAECATVGEIEAGDHVILLARVEGGSASADGLPLVYFDRRFGSWIDAADQAACAPRRKSSGAAARFPSARTTSSQKTRTTSESNCVPAHRRSSANASSSGTALR